jgi:hypothetical protein
MPRAAAGDSSGVRDAVLVLFVIETGFDVDTGSGVERAASGVGIETGWD